MKKIGIMSMQRVKNYGSFLQAYGLKKNIEQFGYEVEFVDYEFGEQIIPSKKKNTFLKILKNINMFEYLKKKKILKKYNDSFDNKYIPIICNKGNNIRPKDIDMLVIGSDEVFNCLQEYPVGYSKELFGKNYENIPIISYAASFGQTNYEGLKKYGIVDEVSSLLKKFKSISVRDSNSFDTVYKLTGIKSDFNLDPVLVTNYDEEEINNVTINNYIIVYAYPGRLTKAEEIKIKEFAKKHNKKIVSLGMYQRIADIDITVHPFEIFSYFKQADFIITDTFHGSIFSIKTHSKFCTIVRNGSKGNSNKLIDLLTKLCLQNRIMTDISKLDSIYCEDIDYNKTDKIIADEILRTNEYLRLNLEGEKNEK